MNHQTGLTARRRKLTLRLVLSASLAALCAVGLVPGSAQSAKEEREFEDRIPAHLPIKVKVKNLDKAKDLKNENWLGDLEIEVKNAGDRPIYFLKLGLFFKDVKTDSGEQIGYPLVYGRPELIQISNHAAPDDVPIQPGESYVFKLPEGSVKGWEWYRTKVEKKPHPKKVGIRFDVLNHGDGTGFVTTGGVAVPREMSLLKKAGRVDWQRCPPGNALQSSALITGSVPAGKLFSGSIEVVRLTYFNPDVLPRNSMRTNGRNIRGQLFLR